MGTSPLSNIYIVNSSSTTDLFIFLLVFLMSSFSFFKFFCFDEVQFFFFFFSVLYLVLSGSHLGNLCLPQGCKSSLLSSSRNIVILDFMFKSVTYFELVLVSRVTQELRFIFSHEMDIQLLQHQLLKRLSWHP